MARNSETPGNPGSLTRRTFLRDSIGAITGVALLSPAVVPASVFGANAPSNRVTVGMIGMGRQAYYVAVPTWAYRRSDGPKTHLEPGEGKVRQ
jgi:hypothetical protein